MSTVQIFMTVGVFVPAMADGITTDQIDVKLAEVRSARARCGPLCAYYCLRRLGYNVTFEDMRRTMKVGEEGVALTELLDAVRAYRSAEAVRFDTADPRAVPPFSILIVEDRHCVVFEGFNEAAQQARVFEPGRGAIVTWPASQFRSVWQGKAIVFPPRVCSWRICLGLISIALATTAVVYRGARWVRRRYAAKRG